MASGRLSWAGLALLAAASWLAGCGQEPAVLLLDEPTANLDPYNALAGERRERNRNRLVTPKHPG